MMQQTAAAPLKVVYEVLNQEQIFMYYVSVANELSLHECHYNT